MNAFVESDEQERRCSRRNEVGKVQIRVDSTRWRKQLVIADFNFQIVHLGDHRLVPTLLVREIN